MGAPTAALETPTWWRQCWERASALPGTHWLTEENTEQQQPAQCWFPQWEMVPSSTGPVSLTCTREECPQRITKPSHVPHTVELETSSGQQPSGLFHCTQEGSLCLQILWQEMLHRQLPLSPAGREVGAGTLKRPWKGTILLRRWECYVHILFTPRRRVRRDDAASSSWFVCSVWPLDWGW